MWDMVGEGGRRWGDVVRCGPGLFISPHWVKNKQTGK